jgi:hypothetical protein
MSRNTGGPAFPALIPMEWVERNGRSEPNYSEAGMTLRDWFAGQALAGLSLQSCPDNIEAAKRAYKLADAMLSEREP